MAGLDEISRVIGGIEADVRYIRERVDHTHQCLHRDGGALTRITSIEQSQAYERGKAAGLGFLGGAGALGIWKGVEAIAAKFGIGT